VVELMFNPPHPGEILRDACLGDEPVAAAADRLGVDPVELGRVLDGERPLTPALAISLERGGWSSASILMRLQAAYDLAQERLQQGRQAA